MIREEVKLCDYGCNSEAKFQLKNGKWCCSYRTNKCPSVREKNRAGCRKAYSENRKVKHFKDKSSWNQGLTKETDSRIFQASLDIKQKYKNGTLKPSFLGRHHSEETKKIIGQKCGGYHKGIGHGKHGWYKDIWCDSSWELAYVIYNLEHNIFFERNKQMFKYEFNNKIYKYCPDFKLSDGSFVEIKGYLDERGKAKIDQFRDKLIIIYKKDIRVYIDYTISKYGKDFIKLYKDYKAPEFKHYCSQCGAGHNYGNICKICSGKNKVKIYNILNKSELSLLIKNNTIKNISKLKNISAGSVSKLLKEYNIKYKKPKTDREKQVGSSNSQFGSMWIYNSTTKENKKIRKTDIIPEGWTKGRKLKHREFSSVG